MKIQKKTPTISRKYVGVCSAPLLVLSPRNIKMVDLQFWLQLAVVLFCLAVGGRFGGVGLGAAGGFGVSILVLGFGMQPGSPPVSVLLIITAVIACTSVLQGSGGLDYLVGLAEKLLRKWPRAINFVGPVVCSILVILVGTAYVALAVYPVVAEVAASAKIRPERAVSASVICAGIGVMASPMSAAMAAMVGIMSAYGYTLLDILSVSVPTYFIAVLAACLSVNWRGSELEKDPEFIHRVQTGQYTELHVSTTDHIYKEPSKGAKIGVLIFAIGILTSITIGSSETLRPSWEIAGKISQLPIPSLIQMVMLATALVIIVVCKVPSDKFASGSVFRSGLIGVVGVFGISWLTGTFFDTHKDVFVHYFSDIASSSPIIFCIVCFCFSAVIFSPTVSTTILMPIGLALGLSPQLLVGIWASCYGDFVIPGGAQIGCTAFDRTGTTRLGSFVFNHSYMRPGLAFVIVGTAAGWFISQVML